MAGGSMPSGAGSCPQLRNRCAPEGAWSDPKGEGTDPEGAQADLIGASVDPKGARRDQEVPRVPPSSLHMFQLHPSLPQFIRSGLKLEIP